MSDPDLREYAFSGMMCIAKLADKDTPTIKPLVFIGSSLKDLRQLPKDARQAIGHALFAAQMRAKHPSAQVLKGFSGATVSEVVEDHDESIYRAVYTVRFADVVYVLHVFQKKSKSGISTPKHEIDKIKARMKEAEITYANHIEEIASQRDEE